MSFFGSIGKGLGSIVSPLGAAAGLFGGGSGGGIPNASSIHNFYGDPMNAGLKDVSNQYKSVASSGGGPSYQGADLSGPLGEYDTMRQQATQSQNQQTQQSQDQLNRQYASMGMLNSGSAIKQGQLNQQQGQQNLSNTMGNIGFQEAQTRRGIQQADLGRQFQSSEAGKQRAFGAIGGQLGAQQADLGFKNAQQEQAYNNYNAEMNNYTQKHSGGLLGSGGFLGTGIGA